MAPNGTFQCGPFPASCPEVRRKNSEAVAAAHVAGKVPVPFTFETRGKARRGKVFCKEEWFEIVPQGRDPKAHRESIKSKLIEERGHCCERCLLKEWLEKPITLELEHENGDRYDNQKQNLKLLCPNCHSYTPTWRRRKKISPVAK